MHQNHIQSIIQALIAAVLFGASAPLAKLLLGGIDPIMLAAFLYLGSGIGLLVLRLFHNIVQRRFHKEAQLAKSDFGWLAGAIITGGLAAPITLLFSLKNTPAATASLLLNFEGVATTLIAFFAFRESVSRHAWWAIVLITIASIFLTINVHAEWGLSLGSLGIIVACILWGIDNNFTRNISAKDPLIIVVFKGFLAGSFSLIMAFYFGNDIPAWNVVLEALLLGCLSYGASIVLFIHSLRGIGAARTSALFSTAPIAGIILSFLIFQEFPSWLFFLALPLMVIGAFLLVYEEHGHFHIHEEIIHDHAHSHNDGHHDHKHEGYESLFIQKHSHIHRHEKLTHNHSHMPDLHHRHTHSAECLIQQK